MTRSGKHPTSLETVHDPPTADNRSFILGTAGHIDHGKTALVRALTNTDTDRLPEEKKRGMTIDIGFAHLDVGDTRLGIIDVPGHERFIRNMVAGATGNDLAMLVIAADDSVMPQSREHLEILCWLGMTAGVIVITKCDLADEALLELVEEDIHQLTAGTFLENAPIVRTSTVTGEGIEDLKMALAEVVRSMAQNAVETIFRMPVDRAFNLSGRGTIVTGTITSGEVRTGHEVSWLPEGRAVRVRSIESHDMVSDVLHRGQRAAIGLATIHHSQVERGHELATPGWLQPTRLITVRLVLSATAPWPIHHRARARIYLGTAERIAVVSLLEGQAIAPGNIGIAQFFLREPVTATCNQAFVVRSVSPVITLGGGRVLQPAPHRISRRHAKAHAWLPDLESHDPLIRAKSAIRAYRHSPWTTLDLCRDADMAPDQAVACQKKLVVDGHVVILGESTDRANMLHHLEVSRLKIRILDAVHRYHETHRLELGIPTAEVAEAAGIDNHDDLCTSIVSRMVREDSLQSRAGLLAIPSFSPHLTEDEKQAYTAVLRRFNVAGFTPPTQENLCAEPSVVPQGIEIASLLRLAAARSLLVHVGQGIYLSRNAEIALRDHVASAMAEHSAGMTVSEIRQLLGTTRKFAVPLCEYLDRIGFTRRHGDRRNLATTTSASPPIKGE